MENTFEKNHVRAVGRARPVFRALAGAALALLGCAVLGGCDKGTDPKPTPKYLLYAGMDSPPGEWYGFIAIIDCETDSVVDSIATLFSGPSAVVSPDGRYFAVISGEAPPQIFDAVTRLPIRSLAWGFRPAFFPDAGILVCPDFDSALVYSLPDFAVKEVWPRPNTRAERGPGRGQFTALERRGVNLRDWSKLVIFDYLNYRAVDSIVIDPDAQDVGFQIHHFTFSPDGMRLYAIGDQSGFGTGLIGYDIRARQTLFRQPSYGPFGNCRVTPDGSEVWVVDPGYPIEDFPGWPQTIFIYDVITGTLMDTVSIRNISPDPYEPLVAQDIRFLPDGSKAYVNCGSGFKGLQPILVINTVTRHVDRLIYGGFRDLVESIDIAPRP